MLPWHQIRLVSIVTGVKRSIGNWLFENGDYNIPWKLIFFKDISSNFIDVSIVFHTVQFLPDLNFSLIDYYEIH